MPTGGKWKKPLKTKRFHESPTNGLRAIGNLWR
jgi:hypothetical protein